MSTVPPALQKLVQTLIAIQAAQDASGRPDSDAIRACDKLREPLTKLAGVGGFRSLMSRALTLARAEVPGLDLVQMNADGSLQGIDAEILAQRGVPAGSAGAAVLAQLLGLLISFVGESLTLAIVRDAWPTAWANEAAPGAKE